MYRIGDESRIDSFRLFLSKRRQGRGKDKRIKEEEGVIFEVKGHKKDQSMGKCTKGKGKKKPRD